MSDQLPETDEEQEELWDDEEEEDEFGVVCGEETCDLEGYEEDPKTHKKKVPEPPDVQEYYSRELNHEYPCIKCGKPYRWGGLCDECTRAANAAVVYTKVEVPAEQFDSWDGLYSGDTLMENRARGLIHYKNKSYVVTGGVSGRTIQPVLIAHEVVPQDSWHGEHYFYSQLIVHNGSGGPFHSNYQRFSAERGMWVILPNQVTEFTRKDEPTYQQASMF